MGQDGDLRQGAGQSGDIHVGGSVVGTGIAIGHGARVELNYYAVAKDLLRTGLRHQFDGLLEKYRRLFAGRTETLQQIAGFVAGAAGGYLVITAPAGFGKTALIAELVSVTPDAYAYHFFAPYYWGPSVEEDKFLRNVVDQVASWHGLDKVVPTQIDELAALYHELLGRDLAATQVLVLDGLDEVSRWKLQPYLSRRLPPGLCVILTVRDVGQDWLGEYQLPAEQVTHLPLDGLDRDEVAAVMRAAGGPAAEAAADPALLGRIVDDAAYAADPQQGADPFYVHLLAEDLAQRRLSGEDLVGKPPGLRGYLDRWLAGLEAAAGDEANAQETLDVLGFLAVARGPLGRADLEAIIPGLRQGLFPVFPRVLEQVRRFVSGNDERGYALMHPRLREHLRDTMGDAGASYRRRLLDYCAAWQEHASPYALAYYVEHLHAAGETEELYATVLDEKFRQAQRRVRQDIKATDYDLRLALQTALAQDRPVNALACVAAHRDMARSESMAAAIFAAIGDEPHVRRAEDFARARQLAAFYGEPTGWPHLLLLYLAWEAAVSGLEDAAARAVAAARQLPAAGLDELAHALLVRTARTLVAGDDVQAAAYLRSWGSDEATGLLQRYRPAPPTTDADMPALLERIDQVLDFLENAAAAGRDEAIHDARYLESVAEEAPYHVRDLRQALWQVAGTAAGRQRLERFARAMLANAYPRYRDIGLVEAGLPGASVPLDQDPWLRALLRRVLPVGLDWEGVTFTFDLPALLLQAAERRQLPSASLGDLPAYCHTAATHWDRWGTSVRGLSAMAAADFWLGDPQQAEETLREAESQPTGFAGFATKHLLALADRWREFGGAVDPGSALGRQQALMEQATTQAYEVRDEDFRQERIHLVEQYQRWTAEALPVVESVQTTFRQISDGDTRLAYLEHVSARLAGALEPDLAGLKALVPLALTDGTSLDALLGRLVGVYLSSPDFAVDDAELAQLIRLCQASLTTGMPWAREPLPQSGVYLRSQRE